MRLKIFLIIFLCNFSLEAQEQDIIDLNFYGDAMVNTFHEQNRLIAFDHFKPLLDKILKQTDSYQINLDSITGINILHSSNNDFRIISWQLELETGNKYYAFIQNKDNTVFEWRQNNEDLGIDFHYYIHSPDDWYGAVYYDLQEEMGDNGEMLYLLYGFKRIDNYIKSKIVDVLVFDENGIPVLGNEIFVKREEGFRDDIYTKLLIKYDASAYVNIKYNENLKLLLYDHLVSKMGHAPGQGMTLYPDGTYEGYVFKDGKFIYKEKIFDQINTTVPRDNKKRKKSELFPKKKRKK